MTPEDRFAVGELASASSETNVKRVPVVSSRTPDHIIVLGRTGAVDALTGPDDQPGLAKDAHTLCITKRGAEIRTRSSATLYNVAQTNATGR